MYQSEVLIVSYLLVLSSSLFYDYYSTVESSDDGDPFWFLVEATINSDLAGGGCGTCPSYYEME
jgi:hypothetical protein